MSSILDRIKSPIENELKEFKPYFKELMHSKTRLLNFIINYSLKTKGKQMRPMLVFLSCKMLGLRDHNGCRLVDRVASYGYIGS